MAATQKVIAKKLGLSISLVSRVLSGSSREIGISPATEQKVRRLAKELGYSPNAAARSLRGKSTHTIGVVVYDFSDPFFGDTIALLQELAHRRSYSLILSGFLNRKPDKTDLLALQKYHLDGIVIVGSGGGHDWLEDFKNVHLPKSDATGEAQ